MSRLLRIALIAALGLGVVGAAIAVGDAGLFVSPPEMVAEEFARKVVTGRYVVAMRHVVRESGVSVTMMRLAREELRRQHGDVDAVDAVTVRSDGVSAEASARLTTSRSGVVTWQMTMVRRAGVWRIREWLNNSQLPTANSQRQLPTANSQLPTADCLRSGGLVRCHEEKLGVGSWKLAVGSLSA